MSRSDLEKIEESVLLGDCLLGAQKVEFTLYSLVSFMTHLPQANKDARLKKHLANLTPEKFLRGPISDLKATLGMLEKAFGESLLLSGKELSEFINDRNLVAHNYWRLTRLNLQGAEQLPDPITFLKKFLKKCEYWNKVLRGLLTLLENGIMDKQNIPYVPTKKEHGYFSAYYTHVQTRSIE